MKQRSMTERYARYLAIACLAATTAWTTAPLRADKAAPERLRQESAELEARARELKAQNRPEAAQQTLRAAEERWQLAERLGKEAPEAAARERHRAELKHALKQTMGEFEELREAGKLDRAAEAKKRIGELERELQRTEGRPEARTPAAERRPEREGPPPLEELHRKLHHLRVAMDNLHAAGLHEIAERLGEQAREIERHIHDAPRPAAPHFEGRPPELEQLRAELQELREMMRRLQARMEPEHREHP